jgi:hypothetical protein
VNSLYDGGDVFVKVVKVSDYLYKAQINKGVTTADDTAINLLLPDGCGQFGRKFSHDQIDSLIELFSELLIHEVF